MSGDSVTLAYVHDVDVTYSFHHSLVNLLMFDAAGPGRIMAGGYNAVRCARSSNLAEARNRAVESFLTTQSGDWLFWIDTDMGFAPDTVERLLAVADPVERPIVGGLCFAQRETAEDGMSGYRTTPRFTILDWVDTPQGKRFMGRATYPVNSVVRCGATGAACILIHRSVFERIAEKHGPAWYSQTRGTDGSLLGEDVSFCLRAGSLGIPVHVSTAVRTTHLKNVWLGEQDFWNAAVVPPAAEPAAVIVPVLRRPQNAAPFMASLRASTGLANVYAVAQVDDVESFEAWTAAGATVLSSDGPSFAEKVNVGYRETSEPWLFTVGDDVRFHPGWLDHAQAAAGDRFHVVGTNDLGPRVVDGLESPHQLFRRSYIDELGASWDGPGVVCHEGYKHGFVDIETALVAKVRRAWTYAPGSVVEHLHPLYGKGERDEVYDLGDSVVASDRAAFEARLAQFAPDMSAKWQAVNQGVLADAR